MSPCAATPIRWSRRSSSACRRDKVRLYARYQSASKWEQVTMQPQAGGSGFQFLFAGLPESVEYYVEAGPLHSKHFNLRVLDLPAVKQIPRDLSLSFLDAACKT